MVWFYTREQQSLRVETHFDEDTQEYVAVLVGGSGVPDTKRFSTLDAFRVYLLTLQADLAAANWQPDGQPHVLPEGWSEKPWSL